MSNEAVRAIVEAKLATVIGATAQISYDNVLFKETRGTSYVDLIIENTFSSLIGPRCRREVYMVEVRIFTKYGNGTKDNFAIADNVINSFVGYSTGTFCCKSGKTGRIGRVEEWHQTTVYLDAQYDNHF